MSEEIKPKYMKFDEFVTKGLGLTMSPVVESTKPAIITAHDTLEVADRICESVFGPGKYTNADVIAVAEQVESIRRYEIDRVELTIEADEDEDDEVRE